MTISNMDSTEPLLEPFLVDLNQLYNEIKQEEWTKNKFDAVSGLSKLARYIDQATLLFGLRMQARFIVYGPLYPGKLGVDEDNFKALLVLAEQRMDLIRATPILWAYWQSIELLKMSPSDPRMKHLLGDHLAYLFSHQATILKEDYIDNLSYLTNYCIRCLNEGNEDLRGLQFMATIRMVERKYGLTWDEDTVCINQNLFLNVANGALLLKDRKNWVGVKMEGLELSEEGFFSVYDWIEEYLSFYTSRLPKNNQKSSVDYLKCRMAFHQEDFEGAAELLHEMSGLPFREFGMSRRRIEMMTYYELRYRHGGKAPRVIRKIESNVRKQVTNLKANIKDLEVRQNKLSSHAKNFSRFVEGYEALINLREGMEAYPRGHKKRSQLVAEVKSEWLSELADFSHESGEWLRKCFYELT